MAQILIIEDERDLQEAYGFLLSSVGHTVYAAYNGQEGLEKAGANKVDIIFLDINMPIMNGLEFLANFIPKRKGEKIIVFSNMLDKAIEGEVLEKGVNRVILKSSVTPSQLIEVVNSELKLH